MQEQLSKNRIIVMTDQRKDTVTAEVTSSTHDRVVKTYVMTKAKRLYLRHNSFKEIIPIVIALKAMGITSDKEIIQLTCGPNEKFQEAFGTSLEEAARLKIFTRRQALEWIAARVSPTQEKGGQVSSIDADGCGDAGAGDDGVGTCTGEGSQFPAKEYIPGDDGEAGVVGDD